MLTSPHSGGSHRNIQHRLPSIRGTKVDVFEIDGWHSSFADTFMAEYWQKKPLLVRRAFPRGFLDLDLADLVELATLDDVESRLLVKKSARRWSKEYGPFAKEDLESLQSTGNWTLLVQEVDRHVPHIADLWNQHFSFIPEWRRDDVMISYAGLDGGIGGHVDNYDVFLIQGRLENK
jgi:50S ribosomal protein L16 3-hydroxylase